MHFYDIITAENVGTGIPLNDNDEIELPGTSGTSRFAFDFLDTESEEDVFSIWNN